MPHPEQLFRWTWELRSSPESLCALVSNIDRSNRDCGYPTVTVVPPSVVRSGTACRSAAPAAPTRLTTSVTAGRTTLKGFVDTFEVWRVRST